MMKKLLVILTAIMIISGCSSGPGITDGSIKPKVPPGPDGFTIIGKWISTDKTQEGQSIIFKDTGYMTMTSNQLEFTGSFSINFDNTPFQLNMNLREAGTIKTIFRIIDNDTIEVAGVEPGTQRPKKFDKDSEILVRAE